MITSETIAFATFIIAGFTPLASSGTKTDIQITNGTGFFVNSQGVFVSAKHVCYPEGVSIKNFFIVDNKAPVKIKKTSELANYDAAIFRSNNCTSNTSFLELGDSDTCEVGDELIIYGFPSSNNVNTVCRSAIGQVAMPEHKNKFPITEECIPISIKCKIVDKSKDLYILDDLSPLLTNYQGASGGPVISVKQNKVIGIFLGVREAEYSNPLLGINPTVVKSFARVLPINRVRGFIK